MRIDVRLDPGRLLRWQAHIVEELARDPALSVQVRRGAAEPWPRGVATLLKIEQTLYGAVEDDPLAPLAWSSIAAFEGDAPADLELDLAGDGGEGALQLVADGLPLEAGALVAILDGDAPQLAILRGSAEVLNLAWPAVEAPRRAGAALGMVLGRAAQLAIDAVRRVALGIEFPALPAEARVAMAFGGLPTQRDAARFLFGSLVGRIETRLLRLAGRAPNWFVATRLAPEQAGLPDLSLPGFRRLPDDGARFYADPFLFAQGGRRFLFVEDFPFATGRGLISVAEIDGNGLPGAMRPVLETDCHLSYPFVFAHQGQIFMIPETSARRTVELYVADPFPDRWTLHSVLLEGEDLGDATLVETAQGWWMFAASRARWTSSWDALSLYSAPSLFGPWQPHPQNPVLVDVRAARPAGHLLSIDGGLVRPVQDSSRGYGSALGFAAIERLDPSGFRQTMLSAAPPGPGLSGLHTYNRAGGVEAIDLYGPRHVKL